MRAVGCRIAVYCPPLVKAQEAAGRRGVRTHVIEVMQVWQIDSSIAQDVRGVRGKDTVKICRV